MSTQIPKPIDRSQAARILIVDDDAGDLMTLCLTLQSYGFRASTCTDYDEGIRRLETDSYDFVMVSQGTTGFEGRRVLDRAMQLNRHLPVLVLTRCIDMPCYLEAMQMGAIDYLEKPVPAADLMSSVLAHTGSGRTKFRGMAA